MLVYDICNEKSFENIKNWIRNIEEVSFNWKHTDKSNFYVVEICCLMLSVYTCVLCNT